MGKIDAMVERIRNMRRAITMKHSILLMMIMSISIMIAVLTGTAPVYCDADADDDTTREKGSCSVGGNDSTATDSTSPETKPKDEKYVQILNMARNMEQELIDIRRQLHRRPATKYEEYEAQEIVIDTLNKLRLSSTKMAITGVMAELGAKADSASEAPAIVVLRADMDALPIHEETDLEYKSEIDGVMHACGHDVHTTMLLGAAKLLKPFEKSLADANCIVRFAFQPSEEGGAGAKMMIDEGLLDGANVAYMLHVSSKIDAGIIASRPGVILASPTFFTIIVTGKGGHAASPFETIDPVNAAAQVVLSLNTIVGRMFDNANDPVVISVSTIHGGDASNIVPEKVVITGTIRTLSYDAMKRAQSIIRSRAVDVAQANGCEGAVYYYEDGDFENGRDYFLNSKGEKYYKATYPETYNHPSLFEFGKRTAIELFKNSDGTYDEEKIFQEIPNPAMGGEDFAFFGRVIPSCTFVIGTRGDNSTIFPG